MSSCLFENPEPASIEAEITSINRYTVTIRVNVLTDNGYVIFQKGVCYNSNPNPTIGNNYTTDPGSGKSFDFTIEVVPDEKIYLRPYAVNGAGISYGNELEIEIPYIIDDSGTTWIGQSFATLHRLNKVKWEGSKFIAVGQNSDILTSPDGLAWFSQSSNVSTNLFDVAWSGSLYVAVGNGTIISSPTGVTWTPRYTGQGFGAPKFYGVTWSGSQFIAVGSQMNSLTETAIFSSPDGINWTENNFRITRGELRNIIWSGNKFISVGSITVQSEPGAYTYINMPLIITSSDGTNWNQYTLESKGNNLYEIIWNGDQFITIGNNTPYMAIGGLPFGKNSLMATSADGISWQEETITNKYFFGLSYSGNNYVATGDGIYTSKTCTNWEKRLDASSGNFRSAAWSGKRWVAVADYGIYIYTSDY